jgi:predicted Zn finger-like uncharacterized protein
MIVQCPQCQARYRLEEKQFAGRSEVQVHCTKCQKQFVAKAPAGAPAGAKSVPEAIPEATVLSKKEGLLPEGKTVGLSVTAGPLAGKIFRVTKPRVVVGRSSADIVVDDPEVSRKHCALEVHGSIAVLVDLGSANGTFVDGKRIETCQLEHLSEFQIGATTLMLTVTNKE